MTSRLSTSNLIFQFLSTNLRLSSNNLTSRFPLRFQTPAKSQRSPTNNSSLSNQLTLLSIIPQSIQSKFSTVVNVTNHLSTNNHSSRHLSCPMLRQFQHPCQDNTKKTSPHPLIIIVLFPVTQTKI